MRRRRAAGARRRAASRLVIHWLVPSAAAVRPSRLIAVFSNANARPVRRWCRYGREVVARRRPAPDADRRPRCPRRAAGRARGRRPSRRDRRPRSRPGPRRRRSAPRCTAACCRGGRTARASCTRWRPAARSPGRGERRDLGVRPDRERPGRARADDLAVADDARSRPTATAVRRRRRRRRHDGLGHQLVVGRGRSSSSWHRLGASPGWGARRGMHDEPRRARSTVALSHPDSHRRPRNLTSSARDWRPRVRGLPRSQPWSPPVGTCTHTPRAFCIVGRRPYTIPPRNWNTFYFV